MEDFSFEIDSITADIYRNEFNQNEEHKPKQFEKTDFLQLRLPERSYFYVTQRIDDKVQKHYNENIAAKFPNLLENELLINQLHALEEDEFLSPDFQIKKETLQTKDITEIKEKISQVQEENQKLAKEVSDLEALLNRINSKNQELSVKDPKL